MKPRNIILGIAIPIIVASIAFTVLNTETPYTDNLSGQIKIGSILPLTGDLSSHGEENKLATTLAVADFNEHLREINAPWYLDVIDEDTGTNPVTALEKLTSLHAKGIDVVLGPESSAELRLIKGYADSNGMVLISPSSTSPALAIPDDGVFRLIPDDTKQGPALAKYISHKDIGVIIPVWRGDTWGDGLSASTIESFEGLGGIADKGLRYHPESVEYSVTASLLDSTVSGYVEQYGAENVGVVLIGFAEVLPFLQSASEYDVLDDVLWFGADGSVKDHGLVTDPVASKFANTVQFAATQVGVKDSPVYESVKKRIIDMLGRNPSSYAFSSYDAVWVVGNSILDTQSTDGSKIKNVIPRIAGDYTGAIGNIKLNEAGDLASADYEVWGIVDGEWVLIGLYDHRTGSIELQ